MRMIIIGGGIRWFDWDWLCVRYDWRGFLESCVYLYPIGRGRKDVGEICLGLCGILWLGMLGGWLLE